MTEYLKFEQNGVIYYLDPCNNYRVVKTEKIKKGEENDGI